MPFPDAFDGGITVQGALFALVVLYIVSKALTYRRSLQVCSIILQCLVGTILGTCNDQWAFILKAVSYLPGFRVPFHPFSPLGALLPTSWWNPGLILLWKLRDGTREYTQLSVSSVNFNVPAAFKSSV